jgi:hypothetical protein
MFPSSLVVSLHLFLVVRLLDDGQLGVGVGHGEVRVGCVPCAVQHQGPLLQEPVVHALAVEANLYEKGGNNRYLHLGISVHARSRV